jgi:endonuclease/exonuclease/phosphatase family metal-dependent hydrolase
LTYRTATTRIAAAALLTIALVCAAFAGSAGAKTRGSLVNVMTRNLYLGADLTPAIQSKSTSEFIEANGGIYRQVEATNFPVRAKGLAKEILQNEPDLVGLQEVALWRIAPPSLGPVFSGKPEATTVKYDFLQLLLAQLNKKKAMYKPVVVQDEFDFEAPANANNVPGDGPGGGTGVLANAETNARLTMRDVILKRLHSGVATSSPKSGNFSHLLIVKVAGSKEIGVTRGWTSVDAKVRGSKKFHFVNTHLEAFDSEAEYPSVRAQQAAELVEAGGPATSKSLPVILLGDLNSDVKTEVKPGDGQAYRVMTKAGFRERAADKPTGCCIDSSYDLKTGSSGEMNHKVDHIMTSSPKRVKLLDSKVTGRSKTNGYWDSDHAGLFSSLDLLR